VALVDMNVWKWLYANPNTSPAQLKDAVLTIAKDVWNKYYAPVLGGNDSPLLAIYSHMINSPLYLANYPFGHIIEYQLEKFYANKNWAEEVLRIYAIGNLTPQQWMIEAVGEKISTKPMLED
jgi:oligoendopeptidase F